MQHTQFAPTQSDDPMVMNDELSVLLSADPRKITSIVSTVRESGGQREPGWNITYED
jgi:hypothetical protein